MIMWLSAWTLWAKVLFLCCKTLWFHNYKHIWYHYLRIDDNWDHWEGYCKRLFCQHIINNKFSEGLSLNFVMTLMIVLGKIIFTGCFLALKWPNKSCVISLYFTGLFWILAISPAELMGTCGNEKWGCFQLCFEFQPITCIAGRHKYIYVSK